MKKERPNVFAVSRSLWAHPLFADEAFTEREAWVWLIGAAAWKRISTRGNGGLVTLQRGEFSFSVRFLAEKFGWKKDRVARYMGRLKKHDMVRDTERDSCQVYSICNYNRFQIVGAPDRDTVSDTPRDTNATAPRQHRDKEETGETGETLDLTSFGLALSAACAAAQARGAEVARFPTNRFETIGEEFVLHENKIREFAEIYPAVDIRAQIRAMKGWLLNNRDQRKTVKGMARFMNSWLAREQNKAGGNGRNGTHHTGNRASHGSFGATIAAAVDARADRELFGGFGDESDRHDARGPPRLDRSGAIEVGPDDIAGGVRRLPP